MRFVRPLSLLLFIELHLLVAVFIIFLCKINNQKHFFQIFRAFSIQRLIVKAGARDLFLNPLSSSLPTIRLCVRQTDCTVLTNRNISIPAKRGTPQFHLPIISQESKGKLIHTTKDIHFHSSSRLSLREAIRQRNRKCYTYNGSISFQWPQLISRSILDFLLNWHLALPRGFGL